MILKYNQFLNESQTTALNIDEINNKLSDPVYMGRVKKTFNLLSEKNKQRLVTFLSGEINLDRVENYVKKYNVFGRVKNLFNKGVKNPNDIVDDLENTNESISGLLIAIIVLASVGLLYDKGGGWKKIAILICAIVAIGIGPEEEMERVYIEKDGKEYNIQLTEREDNVYEAEIIDNESFFQDEKDFGEEVDDYYEDVTGERPRRGANRLDKQDYPIN